VKNQEMAQVGRMIDDVPSRSELIQYERRFVELYEQVSDKLDETRKHFSTYNALDQKRTYIHKEVGSSLNTACGVCLCDVCDCVGTGVFGNEHQRQFCQRHENEGDQAAVLGPVF
jgi:hypothetical protein